ncbi:MAG: folate-binding protein [Pseudomonadota bacterium]
MNDWLDFLQTQGAQLEDQAIIHFGDPTKERLAARDKTVMCPLTHYGLIAVQGADTVTFLQGQLSNDVRIVSPTHSQLSAYNSPKGRVLALLRIFKHVDNYYLRMPRSVLDATLRRLRLFVLRANVKLDDASMRHAGLGLSGPDAEKLLATLSPTLPTHINASVTVQHITIVRVAGGMPRFEIYAPIADLKTLWSQFATHVTPAAPGTWRWLDIINGIPEVFPETADAFVLQMLNLHSLDGVSFTKGCYTGQEIVARMYYLGKLKKRMYLAHVNGIAIPQPGMDVYESGNENDQSIGQVVDAKMSPEGGCDLLVVTQVASAETRTLHMTSREGAVLEIRKLPYEVSLERQ